MNYHKFGLPLVLFLGLGALALFIFSSNPSWAGSLPDPLSYWTLDEGSQPYNDFASNNDGTCIDENLDFCPERVTGKIDQGQLFDGASEGLDVPGNSFNWASTDSFTIALWMKRPGPSPIQNEVVVGREDRVENGLHWWVGVHEKYGGAMFILIDSDEVGRNDKFYLLSTKTITDGKWHYVVAVRDAGQNLNILYVDGVFEDSVSITYTGNFASSFADLNIGYLQQHFRKFYYYNGTVDDVQIYNAALSDSEIGVLYRQKAGRNMPWLPVILLNEK
jgi:hypothetical protein